MGTLDVCEQGIATLAGQCANGASRLAEQVPIPRTGPPGQATSAAVRSAHAALGATASALAARVQDTCNALAAAATRYGGTDGASARHLLAQN